MKHELIIYMLNNYVFSHMEIICSVCILIMCMQLCIFFWVVTYFAFALKLFNILCMMKHKDVYSISLNSVKFKERTNKTKTEKLKKLQLLSTIFGSKFFFPQSFLFISLWIVLLKLKYLNGILWIHTFSDKHIIGHDT